MTAPTRIRVFVASPGDTEAERQALTGVVQDVNLAIMALAPGTAELELVRWEDAVHPDLGRAQDVINRQVGDYDVLIGMMWRRFGTPTGIAGSGTEEEFRAAHARWTESGRPRVMFYFCLAQAPPATSSADHDQEGKVIQFREELAHLGLVKNYSSPSEFPDIVRRDLLLLVGNMVGHHGVPAETARSLSAGPTAGDDAQPDPRIRALAAEYVEVRAIMPPGDARTVRMEVLASRMQALAADCYRDLPVLTRSSSAGERLAAVAFLHAIPHPDHLRWLADRYLPGDHEEKPFVQYHAGAALLAAVRVLAGTHAPELGIAVHAALDAADHLSRDSDRYRILVEALHSLP